MIRTVFLVAVMAFFTQQAPEKGLQLVHADRHIGKKVNGEELRIFEGNVYFEQDSLQMWCDRAVTHEQKKRIDFEGQVKVTDGHRTIRAKRIEYFWETRQANCFSDVQIKSKNDSLFADYLEYNFKSGRVQARGDVFIFNRENLTRIWGQIVQYNPDNKTSLVRQNAHLMKWDSTGNDTLNIYADILKYVKKDSQRIANAYDSVRIYQGKLKATCDTAIYYLDDEVAVLRSHPLAWYEDSELRSDIMTVYFDSLKLRSILLEGNAMAKSLADSANGEYDILKGKKIYFYIHNKKPRRIVAIDNASSLYFIEDSTAEDKGANFATADTIKIFMKEGKLDSIAILGGARGTYYPQQFKKEAAVEDKQ